MGRIHILADQVANQIAAGEVVDRPASVVKELLENSLDAGATRIVVAVEGGGRKLIRIADDGSGMVRDDALLAFERHATSKLRSSDDLLSIATLGFRGEALPSIASIARVEMVTRAAGESSGTRMEIAGGKLLLCEDAGAPAGTTITVRDLFFNTPARRKFLKAETTELAHVTALVTHYALAHPDKHFELHSATHALLIAPPVQQAAERIFQIFGKDTLDQLLPLAAEMRAGRVPGCRSRRRGDGRRTIRRRSRDGCASPASPPSPSCRNSIATRSTASSIAAWCAIVCSCTRWARPTAIFLPPRRFPWCCCLWRCRRKRSMSTSTRPRPKSASASLAGCTILCATPCATS